MSLITAFVLALSGATLIGAEDDSKKAAEALSGEWKFITFTKLRRDNPELVARGKAIIATDKLTIRMDDEDNVMTFTLDPKASPSAIDFQSPPGGKTVRGIYKLEKDKLTICFGIEGSARPAEFKSDKNNSIMVLERVKK